MVRGFTILILIGLGACAPRKEVHMCSAQFQDDMTKLSVILPEVREKTSKEVSKASLVSQRASLKTVSAANELCQNMLTKNQNLNCRMKYRHEGQDKFVTTSEKTLVDQCNSISTSKVTLERLVSAQDSSKKSPNAVGTVVNSGPKPQPPRLEIHEPEKSCDTSDMPKSSSDSKTNPTCRHQNNCSPEYGDSFIALMESIRVAQSEMMKGPMFANKNLLLAAEGFCTRMETRYGILHCQLEVGGSKIETDPYEILEQCGEINRARRSFFPIQRDW